MSARVELVTKFRLILKDYDYKWTGNPVETTGNLGLPDRKPLGNHWKPRFARVETTWKLELKAGLPDMETAWKPGVS